MVKEKPNSVRTYDADGFRRRAACVIVRDASEREVMLVSGSKDPTRWVVPGGGIEPLEDPGEAAVREVAEEAGIVGTLGRCLGVFEAQESERKTRTSVFILLMTETLDEWEDAKNIGRKRQWFGLEEARHELACYKPLQMRYLELLDQSQNGGSSPKS